MYRYVHTNSSITVRGSEKQLMKDYVKSYLYSIINGVSVTKLFYGVETAINNIKCFYENLYDDEELFIDSGGYSVIVGDITTNPKERHKKIYIKDFIEDVYCEILGNKDANKLYHYIFSLDIPIFLTNPHLNTVEDIYNWNLKATEASKKILDGQPDMYDKYIWVWHFKLLKQYNIWRDLYYKTFTENNDIYNYALGGMVGLRGMTGIKFSPFIGPIYRLLKLVYDKNFDKKSILHMLGVYGRHDRFSMQFLDDLFNKYYLKDKQCSVDITFDTINYVVSGLYKIRDPSILKIPYIHPDSGEILTNIKNFEEYMRILIEDSSVRNLIINEIDAIHNDQPINDTCLMCLMYIVYSHVLDRIMKKTIDENNLLEMFLNFRIKSHGADVYNHMSTIFNKFETKYPYVFGNLSNNIMENMKWTSNFHRCWETGGKDDFSRIDKGIEIFINQIKFPFDISGDFKYEYSS